MKKHKVEFLVGLFALLSLAALAWLTLQAGAGSMPAGETYVIESRFTNAGGLHSGSSVLVSGVTVGRVEDVRMEPSDYSAIVTLRILSALRLPSDSMASTAGLSASGVWRTVKVRCIRLKSKPCTPGMPSNLPRIRLSSVGQSILAIRSTVVAPWRPSRTARIPMDASAFSMGSMDGKVCWTPSTRCIRLKSSAVTPGSLPKRSRINASSVGQSMFSIRYVTRCPAGIEDGGVDGDGCGC